MSIEYTTLNENLADESSVSSGGLCGAIVTAPFDVAKTRLQSNLFGNHSSTLPNEIRQKQLPLHSKKGIFASTRRLLYHFVETGVLLR